MRVESWSWDDEINVLACRSLEEEATKKANSKRKRSIFKASRSLAHYRYRKDRVLPQHDERFLCERIMGFQDSRWWPRGLSAYVLNTIARQRVP